MGLAELLEAIEAEADEELARLDAESRREAQAIVDQAREEAVELEREPVRSQEPGLQAEASRRLGLARLDAARSLREAREESFGDTLEQVKAALATLRERSGYRSVLRELLREAVAGLPSGRVLRIDPRDGQLVEDLLPELGAGHLLVDPALETWGGLELEADDGRALRNTLEERVANAEPLLRLLFADVVRGLDVTVTTAGASVVPALTADRQRTPDVALSTEGR